MIHTFAHKVIYCLDLILFYSGGTYTRAQAKDCILDSTDIFLLKGKNIWYGTVFYIGTISVNTVKALQTGCL